MDTPNQNASSQGQAQGQGAPAVARGPAVIRTLGSISRALADAKIEHLFDVRQVQNSRNFQLQPLLATGERTAWVELNDYQKLEAIMTAVKALDDAGFGFPEERDAQGNVIHPAESVKTTVRLTSPRTRAFSPRIFINQNRFDRESAQAAALARRTLAEGTDDQKEAMKRAIADVGHAVQPPLGNLNPDADTNI